MAELREYKAIDVLLEAARPLLTRDRSLRLVLVGDGPLRGELTRLASSLGIEHQTTFAGAQGASEVLSLIRGCEVLVLPSRAEAFGIALIEAMACRKPVVASAVGGVPQIIEHGTSGILVEPENPEALTAGPGRVLADHELRNTFARNGYLRVMERSCAAHNGAAYLRAFTSLPGMDRVTPSPRSSRDPHDRTADAVPR